MDRMNADNSLKAYCFASKIMSNHEVIYEAKKTVKTKPYLASRLPQDY
jgi:hypothetical protein